MKLFCACTCVLSLVGCVFSKTDNKLGTTDTNENYGTCASRSADCFDAAEFIDDEARARLSNSNEHADFNTWHFSSLSLLHRLPIDSDKRNVVRQVERAVFSPVNPTPFKGQCYLAAVSPRALEDLVDINAESVWTDAFRDFAAGNVITQGSVPLSHRYGGHQV